MRGMIVYQINDPDYGWVTFKTIDEALEEMRNELEAHGEFENEITFVVKLVEMTQEDFDALPVLDR